MTKLLFVVTEDWYFCSHRLPLAKAAIRNGIKVVVATRISNKQKKIEDTGVKVVPISIDRRGCNPLTELLAIRRLYRIYRQEKPDIVHLVALKPVVLGGLAAELAGVKNKVMAIAGLGFLFIEKGQAGFLRFLVTKCLVFLSRNGTVIVQNPEDASVLVRAGVKMRQITLIRGSGVDLDVFTPVPEPHGKQVVMFAARLLWDKGVAEFVEAARKLKREGVRARFVIVGDPDPANPRSVSREDVQQWEREGVVELWGKKSDMAGILARCNLFCLPSYREGLPKVLLEAMACGRACVTTDAPGCREAVQDGINGLLVPVRDVDRLASAMKRLILNSALRSQMGREGRRMVEKNFSKEIVNGQTLDIYRKLLN